MDYSKIYQIIVLTAAFGFWVYMVLTSPKQTTVVDLKPVLAKYEAEIGLVHKQLDAKEKELVTALANYNEDERFLNERCVCKSWSSYNDTEVLTKAQICKLGE